MQLSNDDSVTTQQFGDWLASPLGQYVLAQEQAFFDSAVADVFGYYAIQLELPGQPLLRCNRMPTRLTAGWSPGCQLFCDPAQLPFPAASIDLLVMPHTLDFHTDPREVLREAERVLVPEGRLILTGFNPWSLWGAVRLGKRRNGMPWQGHFLSLPRIRDWMALLGLEVAASQVQCYAPPLLQCGWRERFAFMESAGGRWWPVGGGIYCLTMIKRVKGMRLLQPSWKKARRAVRPVAVALPDRHSPHQD